jgi:aryl-alcohol dehydrogenase-like predicted oxidoreductase
MGVMAYNPLGGGVLTGKYGRAPDKAAGRLAENAMYRKRYAEAWMFEAAQGLRAIGEEVGVSPVSLAIAWVAGHPAVTCPIIGARSVAQIEPALQAPEIQLTPELYQQLSALAPSPPPATDRSEDKK